MTTITAQEVNVEVGGQTWFTVSPDGFGFHEFAGPIGDGIIRLWWEGGERTYDISAALGGRTQAFMTLGMSEGFGITSDVLLASEDMTSEQAHEAFDEGAEAVRLQPFLLPWSPGNAAEMRGRGAIARGLHQPGYITPVNIIASCVCDECSQSFLTRSSYCAADDSVYMYCSNGRHVLIKPRNHAGLGQLEADLPACAACAGTFALDNPLNCPHCTATFIGRAWWPRERGEEHYATWLYSDAPQSAG